MEAGRLRGGPLRTPGLRREPELAGRMGVKERRLEEELVQMCGRHGWLSTQGAGSSSVPPPAPAGGGR